jgi:hypothetical protein
MSEQQSEFDWSPLGEEWWTETATTCGGSDLQARLACCLHQGKTKSLSARLAGYSGDDESIRQAGSRGAKTTAVMNMMALAKAESGSGSDGTVGTAEAKQILSRLARGSDPGVRIKAIESLNKIEQTERAANQQEDTGDPADTARAIICAAPTYGPMLAAGMWFDAYRELESFPFLRQVAPLLKDKFPEEWSRWCGARPAPVLEEAAAGPIPTPDELVRELGGGPSAYWQRSRKSNGSGQQEEAVNAT